MLGIVTFRAGHLSQIQSVINHSQMKWAETSHTEYKADLYRDKESLTIMSRGESRFPSGCSAQLSEGSAAVISLHDGLLLLDMCRLSTSLTSS